MLKNNETFFSIYISILVIVVVVFSLIKLFTMPDTRTLGKAATSMVMSLAVGFLGGWIATEQGATHGVGWAVAAIAALLSDKIIAAILNIGDKMPDYIDRIVKNQIDKRTK